MNVTELARKASLIGVKSCNFWGGRRVNMTRLELETGLVQWTIHAAIFWRRFMLTMSKGGE